jgi:hypothetical protein
MAASIANVRYWPKADIPLPNLSLDTLSLGKGMSIRAS